MHLERQNYMMAMSKETSLGIYRSKAFAHRLIHQRGFTYYSTSRCGGGHGGERRFPAEDAALSCDFLSAIQHFCGNGKLAQLEGMVTRNYTSCWE